MAHYANYRFPVPEARQLASLESISVDLQAVLEYCDRLDQLRGQKLDSQLWEALGAAAVVRYARCFSPGARDELEHAMLDRAPAELKLSHKYFIAVRSKHVAHSVNEFEENDVTVTIRQDGESLEIQGIGSHHGRVAGLAFQDVDRLRELCNWVLQETRQAAAVERAQLLPLARQFGAKRIIEFGAPRAGKAASDANAKRGRRRP